MSGNTSSFKFFSPLTTPIVARCKLEQQKKKATDFICNFSSDSDNSSIFVTPSKAKGTTAFKQPRSQVIESIITSLESVDSHSESENQFALNLKATKHQKRKTKTKTKSLDLLNSDTLDAYSCYEKSSPIKKSVVSANETKTCSGHSDSYSHSNSYSFQSDNGHCLLPVNTCKLKSNASSPDHGSNSSGVSNENSGPQKSTLHVVSGKRELSSRLSISNESVDSIIGSDVGEVLTSSERRTLDLRGKSHVISYPHQNSSSDQASESGSNSNEQKRSRKLDENVQSKSTSKMKINSQPQKKKKHKRRMSFSSSDSESESDLDDSISKSASTKDKISFREKINITASTGGRKGSPLKGNHFLESESVVDSDDVCVTKSDSDGVASPIISRQDIKRIVTDSQKDLSTVVAVAGPSGKSEARGIKSTSHRRMVQRFQCPEGFKEVDNIGDTILPNRKSSSKEFWLIKTPWDFDISKLDRVTVPLVGSIKLQGSDGTKHFEAVAIPKSNDEMLKMGTVMAGENLDSLVCGPSLAGQIHVIESSTSFPLVEIQAEPKTRHQIPQDLKYRNIPFGAACPLWTMKTNGMAGEKKGAKRKHKEVEKRKKKKKKNKKKKTDG